MKIASFIFLIFTPLFNFGQYNLDETIKNDTFLKLLFENYNECFSSNLYYDKQDEYFLNGASMECYLLQEQILDTLKTRFKPQEFFEIARNSTFPFFRLAAFEAYTQTDYIKDSLVSFFEEDYYNQKIIEPRFYIPMPNSLLPTPACIKEKMLSIVNPSNTKYDESKKLEVETIIYLRTLLDCDLYLSQEWSQVLIWEKNKPALSFVLNYPELNFGVIEFNHHNDSTKFVLKSKFRVKNISDKSITITTKASAHTSCSKYSYTIPPNKEMNIDFKSLVNPSIVNESIHRSITIQNKETGEAQIFKFIATFKK